MATYLIQADALKTPISRNIYGHFSEHLGRCIYEGLYVGENSPIPNKNGMRTDVVEALKKIKVPVLRWPGGCFADTYHWKDGVGPKEGRKKIVNIHWGGVTEDNSFGTHEFFELCDQLGCEPYVNMNVGSGTVQEMSEWVEYITSRSISPMTEMRAKNGRNEPWKMKYIGVGNENWGCGGMMRPSYYIDQYRRYATYCYNLGDEPLYKIACGPNRDDYNWTRTIMQNIMDPFNGKALAKGLTLHYYSYNKKSRSATQFGEFEWAELLNDALGIEDVIRRHVAIMDEYDPEGQVDLLVDEWGSWHNEEPGTKPGFLYQQNTLRDAVLAGLSLNIFNRHSRRVRMANIAQMVNVLQSPVLTEGAKMVLTPTYHVYEMFTVHHDATLVDAQLLNAPEYACEDLTLPKLSESASVDEKGVLHFTLCNLDPNAAEPMACEIRGRAVKSASARVLTADTINAYNDFEDGARVEPKPMEVTVDGNFVRFELPPRSVAVVTVE